MHRVFTKIQIQTLQYFKNDWFYKMWREKRKDTKGVSRSRKTIKDGLYNGQKRKDKRTNNDLQYTTHKLKIEQPEFH